MMQELNFQSGFSIKDEQVRVERGVDYCLSPSTLDLNYVLPLLQMDVDRLRWRWAV